MSDKQFTPRKYLAGNPLPVDHDALLASVSNSDEDGGLNARAENRRQKWFASLARASDKLIAKIRAEGAAIKNRRRRHQGLPPENNAVEIQKRLVRDFKRAKDLGKKGYRGRSTRED